MVRPAWPPVLVWLVAVQGLAVVAAMTGYDPTQGATWGRYDSGLYLQIANDGYDLFRCSNVPEAGFSPESWCGNAGWFPLYPWLVAIVSAVGLPDVGAGALLSWLFALATLVALWRTFLRERPMAAAVGALVYAAFAPGQIYHFAIFPISTLAFFTVLHLWFLHRERWVAAGVAGAAAAMSYPIGVVLAGVSALWLAVASRGARALERLRRMALASGLTLAGALVVVVVQKIETGAWDAYLKTQEKYGHGFHQPFDAAWARMKPAFESSLLTIDQAPAVQTVFVTIVLMAVLAAVAWSARRRRVTRLDVLVVIWSVAFWAFPLTQAHVSLYRSQAALLPLAILVARLPVVLIYVIAGAAAWLTVPMTILFLQAKLV